MSLHIRKPYDTITETINIDDITVEKSYGGVGGRFMDIIYE